LKQKQFVDSRRPGLFEKKGLKMGRKGRKLLKTHTSKMPDFRLSTISMKTSELDQNLHDVHENK